MLKLFAESETIRNFLVDDMMKRGKETIQKAANQRFSKFDGGTCCLAEDWRTRIELEAILDPINLMMLSKNFIELGYLAEDKLAEFIIACVDLSLIYGMLLIHDIKSLVALELFAYVI